MLCVLWGNILQTLAGALRVSLLGTQVSLLADSQPDHIELSLLKKQGCPGMQMEFSCELQQTRHRPWQDNGRLSYF